VTRETIDGANPEGWLPDQKATVEQALVAYTAANAYAGFQENRVGRIAPDYLADIVVIDRDLTKVASGDIQKARILTTFVAGQPRYET
jgi:predicted amidohydrolase YtcJ